MKTLIVAKHKRHFNTWLRTKPSNLVIEFPHLILKEKDFRVHISYFPCYLLLLNNWDLHKTKRFNAKIRRIRKVNDLVLTERFLKALLTKNFKIVL